MEVACDRAIFDTTFVEGSSIHRSIAHSLTRSIAPSLIPSIARSLAQSLSRPLAHSLTHSFPRSLSISSLAHPQHRTIGPSLPRSRTAASNDKQQRAMTTRSNDRVTTNADKTARSTNKQQPAATSNDERQPTRFFPRPSSPFPFSPSLFALPSALFPSSLFPLPSSLSPLPSSPLHSSLFPLLPALL